MKNGIVIGTIACVVAIILIGSALAPIINMTTTTTISVDNDGAIGLKMDKVSSGDFTINYGMVGDAFTATNGTDTQVIDDLCIFYADDNVAVWMDDSSIIMLGKDASNNTIDEKLSDSSTITITKSSAGLEITDGTITQTFPVPTWAYIPKSTGSYGFFLNETEINTGGLPVQYVGSFAGVNCYNSINTYDLPITLDAALTDSELSGARWIEQATETAPEELNPDDLHIIPLDPSIIKPITEPDVSIMAVPTPTYTDGNWGYDLITSGAGNGKAKIVSYSGSGDSVITIPATIGGYDVYQIGKGGASNNVFDNSTLSDNTTVIISDGITAIVGPVFDRNVPKITTVVIPDSITNYGQYAFWVHNFHGLKAIVINENVTDIGNYAFAGAYGYDTMIIKPSNIMFGAYSFQNINSNLITFVDTVGFMDTTTFNTTTPINILNLGEYDWTTVQNLAINEIKDNVPALGYLAPLQYKETVQNDGPASVLLNVIPLITIVGVLLFAVGFTIYRRFD